MRKVKVGIRKKNVDYDYQEYCFAIIKYGKKYFIVKDNDKYSLIGDKIKDDEGRKECVFRIINERTNIKIKEYEEYVTIDEYNETGINKGLENFATFYLIYVDDLFKYKKIKNEELLLVDSDSLSKLIDISYQKEALKILLATFMFN